MSITLDAIYDGEALRPEQPLDLAPNTKVIITIEPSVEKKKKSFLDTARSLNLSGPPDFSARLDDYLYGQIHNDKE